LSCAETKKRLSCTGHAINKADQVLALCTGIRNYGADPLKSFLDPITSVMANLENIVIGRDMSYDLENARSSLKMPMHPRADFNRE
jgi:hypothetical protein